MTSTATRARRADAIANRERVLRAARECFAEGLDAQIHDIAKRAGVGVGTVYRHFENREALVEALAVDCIGDLQVHARAGLEEADAWTGLERFVWGASEKLAGIFRIAVRNGFEETIPVACAGIFSAMNRTIVR